ncbi:aminofutalosine synthase MqnE, partial [bacterium]|nr:aminofutalosine synthase MqnE [bacterium]
MTKSSDLKTIERKVQDGERLTRDDGILLYGCRDIVEIGRLANLVRQRKHGDVAYYIVNSHINHTNICVNGCVFCAFSRVKGEKGAYEMKLEEIINAASPGYDEFHIVGGCHPDLPYEYYRGIISE